MPKRVRVRRDRPSALSWAIVLTVTMLAVYIITLSVPARDGEDEEALSRDERVSREIVFEGVEMYFAALGRSDAQTQARLLAAETAPRGAAGYVFEDGDGFHALGAGYALEADALRITERLRESGLDASVLKLFAGELTLRVTAPAGDVQAIEDAANTLLHQLEQAGSMALEIDRGELQAASARTLAAVSKSELQRALEALKAVDGAADSAVCSGLAELLERSAEDFGAAAHSGAQGAELSGLMRCCHVGGFVRYIGYLSGLSGE